jgi:hypothetical protein
MKRCWLLLLAAALAQHVTAGSVVLRPGDPALDGKDYLLSDADFRAIVSAARDCLQRKVPGCTARRVHVITATKVEVHLGPSDKYGEQGTLDIQRTKGGWRVVQCAASERIILD